MAKELDSIESAMEEISVEELAEVKRIMYGKECR